MADAVGTDQLVSAFTADYMEKLFFFCLKKTGSTEEAADLASDITVNILAGLRGGTVPAHFPAWVWRIAKNRYSVWAAQKRRRLEAVSDADIAETAVPDDAPVEDALIHEEELKLLRRELAFISRDYRDIVVAYYIDNRKVDDIAKALNLPRGTVLSKLFRIREKLKEGMCMAREFGVMSYKPEDVGFIMNGMIGRFGEPWSIICRVLCKNILLAAYRNPSTAEELAVELGVALPYMEDELRGLTASTLLKKNGGKYETNIFIVSAKGQDKIYANLRAITPALTEAIIQLTEHQAACYEENGYEWHEGYQPYEDMKWARLMRMVDNIYFDVIKDKSSEVSNNPGRYGHSRRPNGGEWDLLGLEEYRGQRPAFVGLHSCIDTPEYEPFINFAQYKFAYRDIQSKTPDHLLYEQAKALAAAAGKDITGVPDKVLQELVDYGYLKKTGRTYVPTFMVTFTDKIGELSDAQKAGQEKLFDKARAIAESHYQYCREVIYSEIPVFLKDDTYQIHHAVSNVMALRGAVLEEALKTGYISCAENDERRMLGAYLYL